MFTMARAVTEIDELCVALDWIMLDSGFTKHEKSDGASSDSQVKRYSYSAPLGPMVPVDMVCVQLGSQLIVHASMLLPGRQHSSIVSCMFPVSAYVQKKSTDCGARSILKNTTSLRKHFMDSVIHKMITDLRRALQLPETGTVLCLSHEIKLKVMLFLDLESLLTLSEVSREFYLLAQDPQLWQHLFKRTFGKVSNDQKKTWKKMYISKYKTSNLRTVPELFTPPVLGPYFPQLPPFHTDQRPPTLPYLRSDYKLQDLTSNRGETDRLHKLLNPIGIWQFEDDNVFDRLP